VARHDFGLTRLVSGRFFAALATVVLLSPPASAQWNQWGGPGQDFKAPAKGLASSWPEGGPKSLWTRDLGDGYSAILADGDRLYTMYRANNQEIVIALEAKTGKTLWEHKYDASPSDIHEHSFGDGPRSTPLLVGDRLFTIGVSGTMHCLDKKEGKVHWKHELWKDMGGNVLNHGYASSPVPYKDTIITLVGAADAGIVAFDAKDGHVVWKKHSFQNSYSTPKFIKLDGKDHMVTFMATEIIGLDPANGDLKWQYAHQNQWKQNVCMPEWDDKENLLVFSSPEAGAHALRLKPNGDTVDTEEVWSTKKLQFYHVNTVRVGDHIYGTTGTMDPAFMAAVDLKTGKIAWRERGFKKATCLYGEGKLIVLDEDGQLALCTATPEKLEVLAKTQILSEPTWTVPTLIGKNLYIRDKAKILALDLG